jgi:predicted nuclease of predicted toxin-antitoxin system
MARTIRYHLDEHVARAVANGLRRRGIDVTTAAEAGLLGADDVAHIAFGNVEDRIIFTQDDDFLALAASGIHHSGLAYCRQHARSIGQIVDALELMWEVYEATEMRDRVEFL